MAHPFFGVFVVYPIVKIGSLANGWGRGDAANRDESERPIDRHARR
jgi:hypothetical protein